MVGATGFEPVTTRTPSVCATRLRYAPTNCLIRRDFNTPIRQINLAATRWCFLNFSTLNCGWPKTYILGRAHADANYDDLLDTDLSDHEYALDINKIGTTSLIMKLEADCQVAQPFYGARLSVLIGRTMDFDSLKKVNVEAIRDLF